MQAMSSEWSSDKRASPYHRTRSFVGEFGPCEKLYATEASPDGAGGCAASTQGDWLALYDLAEEKESTFALIGRAKRHRVTCMMDVQRLPDCDEVKLDHDVVHVGFWHWWIHGFFRRRLERKIELTKNQFIAPKIGVLVLCL